MERRRRELARGGEKDILGEEGEGEEWMRMLEEQRKRED